ncbi:formimidoylglutamate deiminase [Rhodospirillaceae bacterium SYSU D60014]|uniref:formimidoylglutamate deiminase n=1 Tax=Virgifigura deserti TaxID=2268457 RepID=UPI000E66F2C0
MTATTLFAETALLAEGWARDVLFEIAADGSLAAVTPNAAKDGRAKSAPRAAGPVLPGMPNLHSHAFQRAMAGLTERSGGEEDSFWTWREVMYGFVGKIRPDQLEAIAAQLYVEMLKAGYTAVGEFHYLHHDPEGRPYADPAEMSERAFAAAAETGIGLTHLPVLYGFGGFGGTPAGQGQRRFLHELDDYLILLGTLMTRHEGDPQIRVGIAPHSLRAVTPELLADAVTGLDALDSTAPIHIHIAEQTKEVEDCLAWSGQRPVEWLLDHMQIGPRWCLVHATHMTETETTRLAQSGAVAGLCPTTEANLGDGLFPARDYLRQGGVFGIGSDSHISVSPGEELRWLEYGQRLFHRRRNLLVDGSGSVGATLYRLALAGGATALGRDVGRLAPGARADLVVLDADNPILLGRTGDALLDAYIFAGNVNPIREVMVGGRWVVEGSRHIAEDAVRERFRKTTAELTA